MVRINLPQIRWCFLFLLLSSITPVTRGYTKESEEVISADTAVAMFESLPTWGQTDETNIDKIGKDLKRTFEGFSAADVNVMRLVVESYIERAKSREEVRPGAEFFAWANVFVFNRFYFDVPKLIPGEKTTRYGNFWIGSEAAVNIGPLWPLDYDKKGDLFVKHVFPGSSGPPYDVLAEFDYFNSRFGVRVHKTDP